MSMLMLEETETVVRPARSTDAEDLSAVLHTLDRPARPEEVAARLRRFEADGSYHTLVAECDGRVLGLAGARFAWEYDSDDRVVELVMLATSAEAQGYGLGRRLLAAVEEWARGEGATRIVLASSRARTTAHTMYRTCGFDDTGLRFVKQLEPVAA